MSSTRSHTTTRDGRFILHYRCKDSWGDHDNFDERWRLVDACFACNLASWSNEGDREIISVAFRGNDRVVVRRVDGETQTLALPQPRRHTREELAMREAVFAAPDDDAPRSVYADWLLQRGDPRGELIAVQLRGGDEARAGALIVEHRMRFLCDDGLPLTPKVHFDRGFVDELCLQVLSPEPLDHLLGVPAIACLRRLDLSFSINGNVLVASLVTSPRLARLRQLELFCSDLSDAGADALATAPHFVALESITLGSHKVTAAALARLRAARPTLTIT